MGRAAHQQSRDSVVPHSMCLTICQSVRCKLFSGLVWEHKEIHQNQQHSCHKQWYDITASFKPDHIWLHSGSVSRELEHSCNKTIKSTAMLAASVRLYLSKSHFFCMYGTNFNLLVVLQKKSGDHQRDYISRWGPWIYTCQVLWQSIQ